MVILLIQGSRYRMHMFLCCFSISELGGNTLLLPFQFCHLLGDFRKPPVGSIVISTPRSILFLQNLPNHVGNRELPL